MSKINVPTNPHRVKVKDLMEELGYDTVSEFVAECCADSVVPACCVNGCEVEPDGRCEHGCPSALIALKLI